MGDLEKLAKAASEVNGGLGIYAMVSYYIYDIYREGGVYLYIYVCISALFRCLGVGQRGSGHLRNGELLYVYMHICRVNPMFKL